MTGGLRALFILLLYSICGLLQLSWAEDDRECLMQFKNSVKDPYNYLSNWDFSNHSYSPVCSFVGVTCWNQLENKVSSLTLEQSRLSGLFPHGLHRCASLVALSLAGNGFTGPLPLDVSKQMKYLTVLDLSQNQFEGSIPADLVNCAYLNTLNLQQNRLSGSIPWELGILARLATLDLSSNNLSGSIPSSFTKRSIDQKPFPQSAFQNNPLLCGSPLSSECDPAKSNSHRNQIVGGSIAGLLFVALVSTLAFLRCRLWLRRKCQPDQLAAIDAPDLQWWKRILKKASGPHHNGESRSLPMFENHLKLTWQELQNATTSFSPANIIGKGGSSTVYKGRLLNGRMIAIKVLHNDELGLDLNTLRQIFITELCVLGKLRHRNLVRILSYFYNLESMAIIMDYMPGGSLASVLLHTRVHGYNSSFGWTGRLNILLGIAEGLAYLHSEYDGKLSVIHGDLKPGNVLLDENLEAHIADFGVATVMSSMNNSNSKSLSKGQIFPVPCWSLGYAAPECLQQGVVSCKGDVFSFGVIVLEVITGEQPSSNKLKEGESLSECVSRALEEGVAKRVIAPTLLTADETIMCLEEITATLRMGCSCTSFTRASRPDMFEVVTFLRRLFTST